MGNEGEGIEWLKHTYQSDINQSDINHMTIDIL